jgi:hypothetical protein
MRSVKMKANFHLSLTYNYNPKSGFMKKVIDEFFNSVILQSIRSFKIIKGAGMAKIMCVGCSPSMVKHLKSKGKFYLIEFGEKDPAERFLEAAASETLPDIIVLEKLPWRGLPWRQTRREMIGFAERLKHRARSVEIVLLNGKVSHCRSPRSITAACRSDPESALSAICRILSPVG